MRNKVWPAISLVLLMSALIVGIALAQTPLPPEELAMGAQLYADNCQVCHGERGEGRVGARLRDFPAFDPNTPRNLIRNVVTNGVPGSRMPAWNNTLTEEQINAIVEYVVSWTAAGVEYPPTATPRPVTPLPTLPNVQGDPTRGLLVFYENCQVCHGDAGQGRIGAQLAKPLASAFPQAYTQNIVENGIANTVMPGWKEVLSDQQIQDVTAYVLSLRPAPVSEAPATPTPVSSSSALFLSIAAIFAVGLLLMIAIAVLSSRGSKQ